MPGIPYRRTNIRYPNFDYSSPGSYFITIVQKDWMPLFGEIDPMGRVNQSPAGALIWDAWHNNVGAMPWVESDTFIVMPDHVHGILTFGSDPSVTERVELGTVIQRFKSYTTHAYGRGVEEHGWPRYRDKLWLPNYYEHIVRNDVELTKLRDYIHANPGNMLERYGHVKKQEP